MRKIHIFGLFFLQSCLLTGQAQDCKNKIIIGERFTIHSSILNQEKGITIHLPDFYNPKKKYPVLYMLDGLAQFSIGVNFSGMSYVGTIPELIVVAIDPQNRDKEYTPTKVNGFQDSGGANQFIDFIEKELFPYIDSAYSTMPYRILSGHSLAGLFVVDLLLSRPTLFNAYIAMDPSLWWDNRYIIKQTANLKMNKINRISLFLSSTKSNQKDIVPFDSAMNVKLIPGLSYKYRYFEDEAHADVVFVSLYYGLRYIFSDYAITDAQKDSIITGKNTEFIKSHYSNFSKQVGVQFLPPENVITRLGLRFINDNEERDISNAIKIFEILKGCYPESANIYKYLAEAYLNNGNKQSALLNYKQSFELNPKDDKLKSKIEELEEQK